jgi:uncharacterized protein
MNMCDQLKILSEALKNTGLEHEPVTYIHGLAACSASGPRPFALWYELDKCIKTNLDAEQLRATKSRELFEVTVAVERLGKAIAGDLARGDFVPWLTPDGALTMDYAVARDWCRGYHDGIQMQQETWFSDKHNREALAYTVPILHILKPDFIEKTIGQPALAELNKLYGDYTPTGLLQHCVLSINRYWRKLETVKKAGPAGRNDPCPCGSGKKYKKCCGTR